MENRKQGLAQDEHFDEFPTLVKGIQPKYYTFVAPPNVYTI